MCIGNADIGPGGHVLGGGDLDFGFPGFANMLTNSGTELMTRAGALLPRTTTYTRSKPSTVTAIDPRRFFFLTVREREEHFCKSYLKIGDGWPGTFVCPRCA